VIHEGRNAVSLRFVRLSGLPDEGISLILRPDVEDRSFHEKTVLSDEALKIWAETTKIHADGCDVPISGGRSLRLQINEGSFHAEAERVAVGNPQDADRGLGGSSDLFSPGYFTAELTAGETIELGAAADEGELLSGSPALGLAEPSVLPMSEVARRALRQFMVKRDNGLTVIAGYPWFLDWGRDTLIALRGIIAAGWLDEAREILKTFAAYEENGTLPNMIRGNDASNRDTSDAPLWFFVATNDLLRADGSDAFLDEKAGTRTIRAVLLSIAEHYISGTPNLIRMDPASGLVYSPPHFTWMDTNYPAGTPREGYPISLQAKWHLALELLSRVDANPRWASLAALVRRSIGELYTKTTDGAYLSDCLQCGPGTPAALAIADDHLRPNQLFAITLGAIDPKSELAANVVAACESLMVPGAVRTLADRPVKVPLAVYRNGVLLNNPEAPFWPQYRGDEDTRRKPAYHNGTAWPWPAPSFMEALMLVEGDGARATARAMLAGSVTMFEEGCLGHLPEIADGGAPHHQRGCGAQAWSVSEWLRVWELAAGPA
jgi:glycogen debranching enzyme